MAEDEHGLLAIEVDADDYAKTAADDTPTTSRTYQSEAESRAIKAGYSAKVDGSRTYEDFIAAVPILGKDNQQEMNGSGNQKVKLSKKDVQLLGYAVGELYYDRRYPRVVELCGLVRKLCEFDDKTGESLARWEKRCRERMS